VKLVHGEYVSYGKVEAVLKTCPIVENICLHADPFQEFVVAIVSPNLEELSKLSDKPVADAIKVNLMFLKSVSIGLCMFAGALGGTLGGFSFLIFFVIGYPGRESNPGCLGWKIQRVTNSTTLTPFFHIPIKLISR